MILFSLLRIFSLSPSCGPSTGDTRLSLLETAFTFLKDLKIRFRYGEFEKEVEGDLNIKTKSILCLTPNFEENVSQLTLPQECFVDVTMDGMNYISCGMSFLIYAKDLTIR